MHGIWKLIHLSVYFSCWKKKGTTDNTFSNFSLLNFPSTALSFFTNLSPSPDYREINNLSQQTKQQLQHIPSFQVWDKRQGGGSCANVHCWVFVTQSQICKLLLVHSHLSTAPLQKRAMCAAKEGWSWVDLGHQVMWCYGLELVQLTKLFPADFS